MAYTITKKFVSYGHYEITITDERGISKSAICSNTDLISRLSSELDKERKDAKQEAIDFILAST